MFKSIFQYELKYWLKQPSTYIYAAILFLVAFVTMTGMATEPPIRFNGRMVNSASSIYNMTKLFMLLAFLLLPAVIGLSIYRDFTTNMHTLLYSYPLGKKEYLLAKFSSSFIVFSGIVGMLGIGYLLGLQMPWVNPSSVQPFNLLAYLQLYGVLLLPNLLLLGVIVFGLVLWTRNIYMGFVAVLLLILFPQVTGVIFAGEDSRFWAALFDPTFH